MTITDTTTDIPSRIDLIQLRGPGTPIDPRCYKREMANRAFSKIEFLAEHNPHMRAELEEIMDDICSLQLKTVKFGLNCLNRMIEQHNLRVDLLQMQKERQLAERLLGLISDDDPRRPSWLD